MSTTVVTMPAQVYTMGIPRNAGQGFIIKFTLSSGVFKDAVPPPALNSSSAFVSSSFRSGGTDQAFLEYNVDVAGGTLLRGDTLSLPITTFAFNAATSVGLTSTLTVDLRDSFGVLDASSYQSGTFAAIVGAASFSGRTGPGGGEGNDVGTTVDVFAPTPRTRFVAVAGDDTTRDAFASLILNNQTANVLIPSGAGPYVLQPSDLVTLTLSGADFSGISQIGIDLNADGTYLSTTDTATNEVFTIGTNTATLTVTGDRIPAGVEKKIRIRKISSAVMNAPRTFGLSGSISSLNGQNRTLSTANANWWQWQMNGGILVAPYITLSPGNETKFRFTNSSDTAVTILAEVVLDQGTMTVNLTQFDIPARSSIHVELAGTPAAGTGAIGPMITLVSGTQPVRGKATFTILGAPANVKGVTLISSPIGVISVADMQ